jgi:hypothetical protein
LLDVLKSLVCNIEGELSIYHHRDEQIICFVVAFVGLPVVIIRLVFSLHETYPMDSIGISNSICFAYFGGVNFVCTIYGIQSYSILRMNHSKEFNFLFRVLHAVIVLTFIFTSAIVYAEAVNLFFIGSKIILFESFLHLDQALLWLTLVGVEYRKHVWNNRKHSHCEQMRRADTKLFSPRKLNCTSRRSTRHLSNSRDHTTPNHSPSPVRGLPPEVLKSVNVLEDVKEDGPIAKQVMLIRGGQLVTTEYNENRPTDTCGAAKKLTEVEIDSSCATAQTQGACTPMATLSLHCAPHFVRDLNDNCGSISLRHQFASTYPDRIAGSLGTSSPRLGRALSGGSPRLVCGSVSGASPSKCMSLTASCQESGCSPRGSSPQAPAQRAEVLPLRSRIMQAEKEDKEKAVEMRTKYDKASSDHELSLKIFRINTHSVPTTPV